MLKHVFDKLTPAISRAALSHPTVHIHSSVQSIAWARTSVLAVFGIIMLSLPAFCQNYLLATGRPSFTTAAEVEMGFVNMGNGNLHIEIPLTSSPQRGSRDFSAQLVYDSRIWQSVSNGTSTTWQPTNVPNSQ